DDALTAMGLTVLTTPVRCPQANAFCERLIGSMRRECLDWLIVLNERHLRVVVKAWHYRPASAEFPARRTTAGACEGTDSRQRAAREAGTSTLRTARCHRGRRRSFARRGETDIGPSAGCCRGCTNRGSRRSDAPLATSRPNSVRMDCCGSQ